MVQSLDRELEVFHRQFGGGRCAGWQLEELIVKAVKSDTSANHQVWWQEGGHDDKADITVQRNGAKELIQIKSGQVNRKGQLVLSGHRLGRFNADIAAITSYLNEKTASIISVSYKATEDNTGKHHLYELRYIDIETLKGISIQGWQPNGKNFEQVNPSGVLLSLRPSMSWQIWWHIPALTPAATFTC